MLFLAMLTGIWFSVAMVLFLVVCGILVLTVMIQKPQGGGLSAAFGASSGSGQTAFGTKTGDALTVATILVFVVWLVLAVTLNIMSRPSDPAAVVTPAAKAPTTTPGTTPGTTPAETPATKPATVPATGADGPVEQPKPVTPPAETPANTPASSPATPSATPSATPPASNPAPAPAPGEPAPR